VARAGEAERKPKDEPVRVARQIFGQRWFAAPKTRHGILHHLKTRTSHFQS